MAQSLGRWYTRDVDSFKVEQLHSFEIWRIEDISASDISMSAATPL
jgi:hypothetical protein